MSLLVIATLLAATPAPGPTEAPREETLAIEGPSALGSFGSWLGSGTFVSSAYYGSYGLFLDAKAVNGFRIADRVLSLGAETGLAYELSAPDNDGGTRLSLKGPTVMVGAPEVLTALEDRLRFSPSIRLSASSSGGGLVTTPGVDLRTDWVTAPFRASLTVHAERPIYTGQSCPPAYLCVPPPNEWSWGPAALAEWRPIPIVSLGGAVSVVQRVSYGPAISDPYTPMPKNGSAVQVATGLSRSVALHGVWRFHPNAGAMLAVIDEGAVMTRDNVRPRVPFFESTPLEPWRLEVSVFLRTAEVLDPVWFH